MNTLTICVFGAASDAIPAVHKDGAFALGAGIARAGHRMVYGAGATGVMGAAARGMDSEKGYIIGVTPRFMDDIEPLYPCTELIYTETMAERKVIMEEQADAFIIGPGGIGTYDEFFQVLTLKELGRLGTKPIIVYNIDGYYNELLKAMEIGLEEKFIRDGVRELYCVCDNPEDALRVIEAAYREEA